MNEKTDKPATDAGKGILRIRNDRRINIYGSEKDAAGMDCGPVQNQV